MSQILGKVLRNLGSYQCLKSLAAVGIEDPTCKTTLRKNDTTPLESYSEGWSWKHTALELKEAYTEGDLGRSL